MLCLRILIEEQDEESMKLKSEMPPNYFKLSQFAKNAVADYVVPMVIKKKNSLHILLLCSL